MIILKIHASKNVISIDISLASLSSFLKDQSVFKNTKLYIFNKHNQKLIASNSLDEIESVDLKQSNCLPKLKE